MQIEDIGIVGVVNHQFGMRAYGPIEFTEHCFLHDSNPK